MRTGRLDRRVQFLRAARIDDGLQSRPGAFAALGQPVWAGKTPISDGERFRADTVMRDMSQRFLVRYSPLTASLALTDRILCEGETYAILGIKEIGRREGFEITAGGITL